MLVMLVPEKKKKINGVEYTVKLMPFGRHRELQFLVFKKLGKVIEHIGDLEGDFKAGNLMIRGGLLDGIPIGALGRAISSALECLEMHDYDRVIELLGDETTASDITGPLDMRAQELYWMQNKYANFIPWLSFALQVQFEDFLGGLGLDFTAEVQTEKVSAE